MSFPNYTNYIEGTARQDIESQQLLKDLDEELGKNRKQIAIKEELSRAVEVLELDAYILNDIANEQKGQAILREGEEIKAMKCYESLMELKSLIKHMDINKMIMCDILKKHNELVNDWRFKEEIYKKRYEQSVTMESRPAIREVRAIFSEKHQLEKNLGCVKQESLQCKILWNNKISKGIAQRNNIIVELMKERKKLIEQRQQEAIQAEQQPNCSKNVESLLKKNVESLLKKNVESFFDVNQLFSNFGMPLSVKAPSLAQERPTVAPKRSILSTPGANSSDGAIKKQVHFKKNVESFTLIQKSPTVTEVEIKPMDKGRNLMMAPLFAAIGHQERNQQSEQSRDIDSWDDVPSSSASSVCISNTLNTLPPKSQKEKPIILENIVIKPAQQVPVTSNVSNSALKVDSFFKFPDELRKFASPDTSVESDESTHESDYQKDERNLYSDLINQPQKNVNGTETNSFNDNREVDSSPTNWNFHVPTASDEFFFDTPKPKTDNSYL